MFFASSDNQFGFKRGLSSSHDIYTRQSCYQRFNNEYCRIVFRWHFVRIPGWSGWCWMPRLHYNHQQCGLWCELPVCLLHNCNYRMYECSAKL